MRRFWISLTLLCIMLGAALVNANYLQNFTDSLTSRLKAAEEMAERGVWEQADTITRQCLEDWEHRRAYLHIIACHDDTDRVLTAFRSVLQYLGLEEMDEYAAANLELITHIELLAEVEQPDWLNIL